ncbi:MAG: polysaccharide pyruvyl transferase family protein [Vicinamibacterales bacterium]
MLIAERAGELKRTQPLIALRDRIRATLEPIVSGYSECALVGFPDSSNVGDSAIWLGELAWLREAGVRVAYRCHERDYDANILELSSPNGLILLHGGGNLGDLWPRLQRLRERVIHDFPGRPIVQLPQTIHFGDREALARARAVFDNHPDLTILVRDTASLDRARREFQAKSLLCPDMAFYLGALSTPIVKDVDVLWLRRTDLEAVPHNGALGDPRTVVTDWLDPRPPALRRLRDALQPLVLRHPRRLRMLRRVSEATFDYQARQRMDFGCGLLARGKVVVTDRLHGHILSLLLGIPHVLLDNSYGKLRHFHETWTRSMPQVRWVESPADARVAAEELRLRS